MTRRASHEGTDTEKMRWADGSAGEHLAACPREGYQEGTEAAEVDMKQAEARRRTKVHAQAGRMVAMGAFSAHSTAQSEESEESAKDGELCPLCLSRPLSSHS